MIGCHLGFCGLLVFHVVVTFSGGIVILDMVIHAHRPEPAHPPCKGFALTRITLQLKCWWAAGDVGWTTLRYSPYRSEFTLVTQVRAKNGMLSLLPSESVHDTAVWELYTSAATPISFLFPVPSTKHPVGHNIFISFVDRHKTEASKGLRRSMTTERVGVRFSQLLTTFLEQLGF